MIASCGQIAALSSMKSPRWLSSSSPTGVSRLIGSFAILSTMRTLSSGSSIFAESSSGVGLAAEHLHQVALRAHQLVDRLDHVHGDADRARLIGDRARDRLADPPGGVGRELVAALVLELVHGLHQADVALLDQVEELQPAVRVLLRDRDDQAQVRLDQLALRLVRALGGLVQRVERLAQLVARHAQVALELRRPRGRARRAARSALRRAPGCRAGGRAPRLAEPAAARREQRELAERAGIDAERLGQLARARGAAGAARCGRPRAASATRRSASSHNASRAAARPRRS